MKKAATRPDSGHSHGIVFGSVADGLQIGHQVSAVLLVLEAGKAHPVARCEFARILDPGAQLIEGPRPIDARKRIGIVEPVCACDVATHDAVEMRPDAVRAILELVAGLAATIETLAVARIGGGYHGGKLRPACIRAF